MPLEKLAVWAFEPGCFVLCGLEAFSPYWLLWTPVALNPPQWIVL